ncbi:MAG: FAD-dependent oxidoreductase, partial [Planctomycetota bacterium]|nr:FAD-dependent oxidoreductase [Planctomycetota bacterium]
MRMRAEIVVVGGGHAGCEAALAAAQAERDAALAAADAALAAAGAAAQQAYEALEGPAWDALWAVVE